MFLAVRRASGPVFMFCAPGRVFGGTEGVESHFHVLHARTSFQRYGGCRVPFSCLRAWSRFRRYRGHGSHVFMFCDPGLIFDGTEDVLSRFHVLRSRTCFRRCRVRWVPFSWFVHPDSFSAVSRATGLVFMFYASGLVFCGTEGVRFCFHILHARTHLRRYRGRRVPFSSIARPDSFSAVPRVSGPVLMFCAPGLIFDGSKGVMCRALFPDSFSTVPFSAVPRTSDPVFGAPEQVFGGSEGVGSHFYVLSSRSRFPRYRGLGSRFLFFCAP
jgi:hypothetical protein